MQAHTSLRSHDWPYFLYKHQQGSRGTIKIKDKSLSSLGEVKGSSVNGEPTPFLTRQETLPNQSLGLGHAIRNLMSVPSDARSPAVSHSIGGSAPIFPPCLGEGWLGTVVWGKEMRGG